MGRIKGYVKEKFYQVKKNIEEVLINNTYKRNIYYIFALLVALFLAAREIPTQLDDVNYINYVHFSGQIIAQNIKDISFIVVDEPLWLVINFLLGIIIDPIMAVRIIIFVSVFLILFALGKYTNYSLLSIIFYLLIEQIVKNNILHLRQGLAIAVFIFAFSLKGKWKNLMFLSPLIHTSFWFVMLFYVYDIISKKLTNYRRILYFTLCSITLILSLGFIVSILGDRRADLYSFSFLNLASGKAFIWWGMFLVLFYLGTIKTQMQRIAVYGIIFYLLSYFLLDFGARVFENFVILVLLVSLISSKSTGWKTTLLTLLGIYSLLDIIINGHILFSLF